MLRPVALSESNLPLTEAVAGAKLVIAKTIDLAQRTRRVVPLIYERVTLPVWLHGLSGIDFTESARVDPSERLLTLLARARRLAETELRRAERRAMRPPT